MSYEPVTIEIEPDCINIMNFPGIDRSISEKTIAEGKRFVSRYYRNRRLGEFLKELDLSEGHSSGIPTIQEELEKNGSPRAEFFTDEDRRAMRIRIPIHPAFIDEANFNQNERRLSEVLSEVLSKTDYEKLTPLIDYIEQNGSIKPKVASDICQKSPSTVRRYLNMLTQTGYVIAEGKTSNMVYKAKFD
jgi:ATP-dependent DNA helicase RecG